MNGIYRSENSGTRWKAMSLPSSPETPADNVDNDLDMISTDADENLLFSQNTAKFFSIAADRTNPQIVYVGANSQPQLTSTSVGLLNASARLFRGDASKTLADQWEQIVGRPADGTAPHADSRNMVVDAGGSLLEVDDGGIYRLENPGRNDSSRKWVSLNGNCKLRSSFRSRIIQLIIRSSAGRRLIQRRPKSQRKYYLGQFLVRRRRHRPGRREWHVGGVLLCRTISKGYG